MIFVYPILLGGLVLATLPVLLHFLISRQPTPLTFPAFRFLMQKERSNTRSLQLRHLLLLLLRIGLVVLVCVALARLRIFQETLGLSREKSAAIVLVFDTSPSMDYKVGGASRLDLAKKRAFELLDQLPEDGRTLILDACDPDSFSSAEWLKSLEKARQRIQSLTIQVRPEPVTKAIDEGLRRFAEWDGPRGDPEAAQLPRFLCVFSDRTVGSWGGRAPAKTNSTVPVKRWYFDVGVDDPVDLAISATDFASGRDSFTAGERIPLRVTVKATGKGKDKDVQNLLVVLVDGKEAIRQAFDLEADKQRTLALDLESAKLDPGFHSVEIRLGTSDDSLAFNNVRFATIHLHTMPPVLVLADDPSRTKPFADRLRALLYAVDHKDVRDKPTLSRYEAVFLVGVHAPSEALWEALDDYMQNGGGVAIIPPALDDPPAPYASAAAQKVMPGRIVKRIDAPAKDGARWELNRMDTRHSFVAPLMDWLVEDWDFLRHPTAYKYWEVEPNDSGAHVVRYDDGEPGRSAVVVGKAPRKVVLVTTPLGDDSGRWHNYNERTNAFGFALPQLCAKYLCAARAEQRLNYQFGAELPHVRKDAAFSFPKHVLSLDGLDRDIAFDAANRWVGKNVGKAGTYAIAGVNAATQERKTLHQFSINVPAEESDLSLVKASKIEKALGAGSHVPLDRKTPLRESLQWDEPMELFPWLMIGLLFLLAFENLLANKFYQHDEEEGSASRAA